jgi:hypothetical protein
MMAGELAKRLVGVDSVLTSRLGISDGTVPGEREISHYG